MTLDKFTIKAQEAVQQAVNTAQQNGQQVIEPVHILKGVLEKAKDVTNFLFQKLSVNGQQIEMLVDQEIKHLPRVQGGQPYLSSDSNNVLVRAQELSQKMGDEFVSCEPILWALLTVNSTASRILKDAGCTEKEMQQAIQELRQGQRCSRSRLTTTTSHWRSMPRIWSTWLVRASSIPLSDVMTRFVACCKSCRVVQRTTLF